MELENEVDATKLKYVLYARKSTTDEARQVRSIPDQIAECRALANRLGLHIIGKPLVETQSAKKPHKRPIFTQMLKDIRAGVYDGILAWHPDRLARNMLEGGGLIDMIDTNVIKDLKFVMHHFTADANGKMLLGMAFVLSKQYSDNLSQNVSRGVRNNFSEGKSPTPKHGYIRDENTKLYVPDGNNFELICEAWEMRSEGKSLEEIADYMNKNGYGRIVKKTGRKISMSFKILSKSVFPDPFYYGIFIQAHQPVDLRTIYDFRAATSEEIYNAVQRISNKRFIPNKSKSRLAFYPLKQMIQCAFCNHNMYAAPSTSQHGKKYLSYRCDYDLCTRKKKAIRAKIVFNFIYDFLAEGLNFTEADYNNYYKKLKYISDGKREKLQIQIHSLEGSIKMITADIKSRALGLVGVKVSDTVRKINEEKIEELGAQNDILKDEIGKLKEQLTDPDKDKLSLEEFLNLSKNAAKTVKSGDAIVKDVICRQIFLNLVVDEEKVLSCQAKEPFYTMLKTRNFASSRGVEN